MKSIRRLLRFAKPYRRQSAIALILLLGMVFADLLIPRLSQRIIDQGIANGDVRVVWTTGLIMLGAALLSALFALGNNYFSVRVGQSFAHDVRSALFHKVQTYAFANLDELSTGQLITRSTSDIHMTQMIVMMGLRILTRAPIWAIGAMVMLAITSPTLALVMLVFIPVILVLVLLFARRIRPLYELVQQKLDRLNTVLQENLAGVRVVKAFVRERHEIERFDGANTDLMTKNIQVMRLTAILLPTMTLVLNLGVIGVLWFGGQAALDGALEVGKIVASISYLMFALFPVMMLAAMIAPIAAADASAKRIFEVLDSEPAVRSKPNAQRLETPRGRVEFAEVGFAYPGNGGAAVLCDVSFVAEPGQTVAILGATGSGKSSLIHLIPRFYDVSSGSITIDGIDLRDVELGSLRAHVGVALQEAVLFAGTIRDNIAYGRPDATDDEVRAAATAAQAAEFIEGFPEAYQTVVGQRGVTLSGGQRQRIAIARALLVRPKVLILDDSTSAVDIETEVRLQDALDRLIQDSAHTTTRFIVAQRISTVLLADKILVLDNGRIEACGTHDELLKTSPVYREIYESQLGDGPRGPLSAIQEAGFLKSELASEGGLDV